MSDPTKHTTKHPTEHTTKHQTNTPRDTPRNTPRDTPRNIPRSIPRNTPRSITKHPAKQPYETESSRLSRTGGLRKLKSSQNTIISRWGTSPFCIVNLKRGAQHAGGGGGPEAQNPRDSESSQLSRSGSPEAQNPRNCRILEREGKWWVGHKSQKSKRFARGILNRFCRTNVSLETSPNSANKHFA